MKMNRVILKRALIGLLVLIVLVGLIPRSCNTILGLIRGEAFYHGQPTSVWADRLGGPPYLSPPNHPSVVELAADDADAVPVLIELLNRDNVSDNIHYRTLEAIKLIGPNAKSTLPALARLPDRVEPTSKAKGNAAVFKWLVEATASIGPEAIPVLAEFTRSKNKYLSRQAAVHLGKFGPLAREAIPALIEAYSNALTEANLNDERTVSYEYEKPTPAEDISNAIVFVGPEAVPALIEEVRNGRTGFVKTLGKFGPAAGSAVPIILEQSRGVPGGMFGGDSDTTFALIQIGRNEIPALIAGLKHKNYDVASHAAFVLGRFKAVEAVPDLILALTLTEDNSPFLSSQAITALAQIGPKAKQAVPMLLKIYKANRGNFYGQHASQALWEIDELAAREAGIIVTRRPRIPGDLLR